MGTRQLTICLILLLAALPCACLGQGGAGGDVPAARVYPGTIWGNWDPDPLELRRMLSEDVAQLHDIGVNLVSVSIEYSFDENGNPLPWISEEEYCQLIVDAKCAGFSVLVAPNFVYSGEMNLSEQGIDMPYERYASLSLELARYWAAIAEAYGVEYYAPQNEYDFISYALKGMDVRGRPAEQVQRDFFNGRHAMYEDPLSGLVPSDGTYILSSMPKGFFLAANIEHPVRNMQVFETGWMHWDYEDKHAVSDEVLYEENFAWLSGLRRDAPELYVTLRYVATRDGMIPSDYQQYRKDELYTLERFLSMAVAHGLTFDMCEFGDEFNYSGVEILGFSQDEVLDYYDACLSLIHAYMPDAILCADVINFLNLRVHPDEPTWAETSGRLMDDVNYQRLKPVGLHFQLP